jgi:GT2 family glycosyltransferase
MTEIDFSFCIVTFKAREYLKNCLVSLYKSPPQGTFEIIVVDNGSADGTREMLLAEFPDVKWIENTQNMGYTFPMNQALRTARGNYLVQLNPDTLLHPGAFDTLKQFMQDQPDAGICTPKVLNRDGSLQKQCKRSAARPWDVITYFTRLSALYPHSPLFSRYLTTYLDENQINEVEAVSGSCMFIRREVIEQIGYLDEKLFAYQEDADFCFRARQAGWKIFYIPEAKITHFGGEGGSRVQPYRSIYQWHRSYFIYYQKHLARDYFFLLNWLFYALMGAKLCVSLLSALLRREKYVGSKKP